MIAIDNYPGGAAAQRRNAGPKGKAMDQNAMDPKSYAGRCFCGAVALVAKGSPEGMGFCHCASCRAWAAAPVNAFTLWKSASVTVTRGAELVGVYHKTDSSYRQFCRACGGHIMTAHPKVDLVDVYAALLPSLPFVPQLHVHYQENVLPIADALPKFKDLPGEMGGSGETVG